ncbi:MAG TPA: right-handed parallel beta-helix repeat-containing protein [Firmicutes bacterium]|nr:right-handed parallel beta-helix repeat-containing protein [Bacillota bacterium]
MSLKHYDPREYGAAGDGKKLDTAAIQAAIDDCFAHGGGYVVLDTGTYLSGTIFLKSNVYLSIGAGAVLKASPDIADYAENVHYNRYVNEPELDRAFIYAEDCVNIGIVGDGEINGSAEAFPNPSSIYRPMALRFLRCKNIKLSGLKLYDSAAWTTAFLDSEDIWIDGLDIYNDKRYNGDGLDFDGCRNVYVSNCSITGTDDNFCLQSSSKEYPVKNIHVSNCRFSSICAAVRIGLKSIGSISDVVISSCTFENVMREGVKIECTEGGNISDIIISGLVMHNVRRPIFIILNNRLDVIGSSIGLTEVPEIGTLERVTIRDVIAVDGEEMEETQYRFGDDIMGEPKFNGIRVDAHKDYPIRDLTLKDIHYTAIGGVKLSDIPSEYPIVEDMRFSDKKDTEVSENYNPTWSRAAFMDIRNVDGLTLSGMYFRSIKADERPSAVIENCRRYDGCDFN